LEVWWCSALPRPGSGLATQGHLLVLVGWFELLGQLGAGLRDVHGVTCVTCVGHAPADRAR
jgi:hypothetical protein